MKLRYLIFFIMPVAALAQVQKELPLFEKSKVTEYRDWLVDSLDAKAQLYETANGKLVFSNGLVSRIFATKPNGATISLDLLPKDESFLRSVRPEAELTINGLTIPVGGLTGQPIHNYLLPEWIDKMKADPASFQLRDYRMEEIRARFPWKKRAAWMPKDLPWPAPGKELTFTYGLGETAIQLLLQKQGKSKDLPTSDQLKNLIVSVHYELYDNLPLFCKWVSVENKSDRPSGSTGSRVRSLLPPNLRVR